MSATMWPDGSLIVSGQIVSCERKQKPKGTWTRYNGKRGIVESIDAGEVLVMLDDGVRASFRPHELILLPQPDSTRAPRGPVVHGEATKPSGGTPGAKSKSQRLSGQSKAVQ